jgi:creatinine amidohydrolase
LLWTDLTSPEVGGALEGGHQVGLLPVGATEQHGPHLPVGTDTIIATTLCERAATLSDAIVLPSLGIGTSFGHGAAFPGTLSLSPESLSHLIRQCLEWAAASGLTRVLCVNAHMGNAAAIQIATDYLRLGRPDLQIGAIDWWRATEEVSRLTVVDTQDLHANRAETSLMLAIAPDMVRTDQLDGADDPDRTKSLVFRYSASALSRNGVTGSPSEASRELGERLLAAIVGEIASRVERGRTEEPPLGRAARPPFTI